MIWMRYNALNAYSVWKKWFFPTLKVIFSLLFIFSRWFVVVIKIRCVMSIYWACEWIYLYPVKRTAFCYFFLVSFFFFWLVLKHISDNDLHTYNWYEKQNIHKHENGWNEEKKCRGVGTTTFIWIRTHTCQFVDCTVHTPTRSYGI